LRELERNSLLDINLIVYGYRWSSYRRHQDEQVKKLQSASPELKCEVIRILLERTLYAEEINFVTHETDYPSESVEIELLKYKHDLTTGDIRKIFEVLYDQHSQNRGDIFAGKILTSIVKDKKDPNSLYTLWKIVKDYVGTFGTGTTAGREAHWKTEHLLRVCLNDVFTPERIEQLKKMPDYQEIAELFSHPYITKEAIEKDKVPLSFFINSV